MNKVFLQLWEESNASGDFLNDGCSLHIDIKSRNNYVKDIYSNRGDNIPERYDRIVGDYVEVFVSDSLFNKVEVEKDVKLSEPSFNNLLKFEEIIYNQTQI